MVPRIKQFRVVGLFQIGMYEYDAGLALIHIDDAAKLYRMGNNVSGLRLKLDDLFDAPAMSAKLAQSLSQADSTYFVTDWTQQHANFFKAVQLEKRVMFIILTLIVAVAAFNIVSTLVMAVTDKRADIAIMRTFGASPGSIMRIFMIQGALIGVIGTLMGAVFGVLIALVACHFGLRVKPNTESLGKGTTASVVTSITVVILVDALFAVLFKNVGI